MIFLSIFNFSTYLKELFLTSGSKSEDGGQTWVFTKEHEESDSKHRNSNQEKDIESNQTENPKKRESSQEKISNSQKNENWDDQLPNKNFGPDQDFNDRDNNDAIEIMSTIDQNDLGPNHLLL